MYTSREPRPVESWQHIGPVSPSEVGSLFESAWNTPGITLVAQGGEGVAAEDWLLSCAFVQCSARLLINSADGSMLLKHIGPVAMDLYRGAHPLDTYKDFCDHAKQMGAAVWAINVRGDYSCHEMVGEASATDGLDVVGLPDISVRSGRDGRWSLAINPNTSQLLIHRIDETGDEYDEYALPRGTIDNESSTVLLEKIRARKAFNTHIKNLGDMPYLQPESVQIGETRAGILESSFLGGLSHSDIQQIEFSLESAIARVAENGADANQITRGVQALEAYLDIREVWERSLERHREDRWPFTRLMMLSRCTMDILLKLQRKRSSATALTESMIVEHLDSQIDAMRPRLIANEDPRYHEIVEQERRMIASILKSAR